MLCRDLTWLKDVMLSLVNSRHTLFITLIFQVWQYCCDYMKCIQIFAFVTCGLWIVKKCEVYVKLQILEVIVNLFLFSCVPINLYCV